MSCLFDLSEGHDIFPIRKNEIDTSSGSCGTTFPCTGKASGQRASVNREKRPPCAKGALPEGRWGSVQARRRNNPSVTCGATSLKCPVGMHKGGLLRTRSARPYTVSDHVRCPSVKRV